MINFLVCCWTCGLVHSEEDVELEQRRKNEEARVHKKSNNTNLPVQVKAING